MLEENIEARRQLLSRKKLYKPGFVLFLFTTLNFLTYYDRGTIAAAIDSIRADEDIAGAEPLGSAEAGLLVSVFMIGFFVTCPLFVSLGGRLSAKTIMLIGICAWSLAVVLSAFSTSYWMLLFSRAGVGIGEAAYVGFTVTIIDNIAPVHRRTLWIGTFYAMLPFGTAIGMGVSGAISSAVKLEAIAGWRLAFIVEVPPMLLLAGGMLFLPDEYNPVHNSSNSKKEAAGESSPLRQEPAASGAGLHQHHDQDSDPVFHQTLTDGSSNINLGSVNDPTSITSQPASLTVPHVPLWTATKRLATNLNYMLLVLNQAVNTFTMGALATWIIAEMSEGPVHLNRIKASILLGGTIAFGGLGGSLAGGYIVDRLGGSRGHAGVYKCMMACGVAIVLATPIGIISLIVLDVGWLTVLLIVAVFLLFTITAPMNSAILTTVDVQLRTYAMTYSIFGGHLIGDVPSPVIVGAISDELGKECNGYIDNMTCSNVTRCEWMPPRPHEKAFCVDIFQLRNALIVIFLVLPISVPMFIVIGIRAKRAAEKEDELEQTDYQEVELHAFAE